MLQGGLHSRKGSGTAIAALPLGFCSERATLNPGSGEQCRHRLPRSGAEAVSLSGAAGANYSGMTPPPFGARLLGSRMLVEQSIF